MKFNFSYSYDVPHYTDFQIEAASEEEAIQIAEKALADGRFAQVMGSAFYENECNHRVFCSGVARSPQDDNDARMSDLEGFSSFTNHYRCPHDGTTWQDVWSCACNDKCPTCNKEIEPFESEDSAEASCAGS